jgi:putative MATE family efflux protein
MFIKNMLKDKAFWKSTLLIAVPVAFQNLLSNSFSLIDLLMVGSLGDDTIAAVGLASQISFLLNIFLFGICSGGMVFITQYWGAGNIAAIKRTYGMIMVNCVAVGFVFCTASFFAPELLMSFYTDNTAQIEIGATYLKTVSVSYIFSSLIMGFSYVLRSTEKVMIPLCTNIVAVILNIFLNYVLIDGKLGFPSLGVAGPALATDIATFINPVLILVFSYFKKSILISPLKEIFSFNLTGLKGYYAIALPVFINEVLWSLGTTAYNSIYGHMGSYAPIAIVKNIDNMVFVLFTGLCSACAVLIGKYVGVNDIKTAKEYSKRFMFLLPFTGLLVGGAVILCRQGVLSFYTASDEVMGIAYILLLILSLEFIIRNISYICIVGIFRAGGDTKTGAYYDLICLWGIGLPVTFVCGILLKMDIVFVYALMLFSEDTIKALMCLRYFKTMKWIKPVNQSEDLMP